ncbi:MAG: hypothetical protein JXD22_13115 [Sedimentisphaerales bacterium]|nr:hypothetical protein [Sedimentisphaerales bacterium]
MFKKIVIIAVLIGFILPVLSNVEGVGFLRTARGAETKQPQRIHSVTDISHEFSFYFDGRFFTQYIAPDGVDARNWGTLHKYDFTNANLLILQSGGSPCPYLVKDIKAVQDFLQSGGAVLVLGDFSTFRGEKDYKLNTLAQAFGAEFINQAAKKPFSGFGLLENRKIESYSPKIIKLDEKAKWQILIQDDKGQPLMARRSIGKGQLVVASRALCGHQPNAKDPINDNWWKPLLKQITRGKTVDPKKRPPNQMPENLIERNRLPIQYSDYMKDYADSIYAVYDRCYPVLEDIMGVPPSEGMLSKLILLPTGGGGFSSGSSIGLAAWWGDFPEKQYGMVELISHESTHSWVLPFPEPMWNEGIATYVGILAGKKLGLAEDADKTLKGWINSALKHDPNMTTFDLAQGKDVPHAVRMAKPMWIFEQLRKEKPDFIARYFQAKRRLANPDKIKKYTAADSVAILSLVMERDLFGWFRSLGITVNRENINIDIDTLAKHES